jgi:Ca2+-binding RTX toxin-like protein
LPTFADPVLPPPPPAPANVAAQATISGDMDLVHLAHVLGGVIHAYTPEHLTVQGAGFATLGLNGAGFTYPTVQVPGTEIVYDAVHQLTGGTITSFVFNDSGANWIFTSTVTLTNGFSAALFAAWIQAGTPLEPFAGMLDGNDVISGRLGANGGGPDLLRGYTGNDVLIGHGYSDTIYGGQGDDQIYAGLGPGETGAVVAGSTYLRGEEGDDYIIGGAGFDDINGNQGDDTASGGPGDDWVVGGKDNDLLFGDDGADIVWGNLGNDTLSGGPGDDQVRGGQGDDSISGGAGADYISGDRGNDTEVGGPGADTFHSFSGAGVDRVLDFNVGEGDRVMLDPGTSYTVSQVGADTVIDMGGGDQVILVGVQMSSLPPGTIFLG